MHWMILLWLGAVAVFSPRLAAAIVVLTQFAVGGFLVWAAVH